jgi:hypothetical protein
MTSQSASSGNLFQLITHTLSSTAAATATCDDGKFLINGRITVRQCTNTGKYIQQHYFESLIIRKYETQLSAAKTASNASTIAFIMYDCLLKNKLIDRTRDFALSCINTDIQSYYYIYNFIHHNMAAKKIKRKRGIKTY